MPGKGGRQPGESSPARYPRWFGIRLPEDGPKSETGSPSPLRLVRSPRVRQDGIFSNLPRSVNAPGSLADNHPWPPLGRSVRVGHDDRFGPSAAAPRPTCDESPLRVGDQATQAGPSRIGGGKLPTGAVVLAIGRCLKSTVPSHQGIVCSPTRSRRRPTTSSIIEDIAMTSLITMIALSAAGLGHGYASAQAPSKCAPCPQAPSKCAPCPQAPTKCMPAPCKTLPCAQAPSKVAPCPQAPGKCAPIHGAPQAPIKAAPQY
jgi:hypothetical protein